LDLGRGQVRHTTVAVVDAERLLGVAGRPQDIRDLVVGAGLVLGEADGELLGLDGQR